MKRQNRKLFPVVFALALAILPLGGCSAPDPHGSPAISAYAADAPRLEDDFYAAANHDVLAEHRAEENGGTWNWFFDLEEKAYQEQKAILRASAAAPEERGSSKYKLGTLYTLAMDQERRDAEGVSYFNKLMEPAMEAGTVGELMDALAILQYRYGFDSLLDIEVVAPDKRPGEYIAQIKDMDTFLDREDFEDGEYEEEYEAQNKAYFTTYLSRLSALAGRKGGEKTAGDVYAFAKDIALSRGKGENIMVSLDELQRLLSQIDLRAYLGRIFKTMPAELSVREPASLSKLNSYLAEENLPLLKQYAYLVNLERFAPYLSSGMAAAKYEMELEYIGDADPPDPEKTAVTQVAALLKWDMGKLYAEKNYTAEKRDAVYAMANEMLAEYGAMLQEEDWLSQATRDRAASKLKSIRLRIGVPEDMERYLSAYEPDPSKGYLENVMALRREASEKQYDSYGRPVDRTVWQILPHELLPCYYPTDNSINIPVSVLEPPYFDPDAGEARNLGALGMIIGHEITHAFDDLGSRYDENGDFANWWTKADRKAFEERAEKIVAYYDNYKTPGILRQDGRQTLGENIADLGSMHCLSRIIEKKSLPPEQFFESYANAWASMDDELSAAIISGMDEHAADKARVNAVLSSCGLFYETYPVREGDAMYIKPENRAALW